MGPDFAGISICGMAGSQRGHRRPIAGVVIILEMTMNYEFALAAMISVVVCLMVSDALFDIPSLTGSFYRGIDVSLGRGHIEMMESPVSASSARTS